MINFVSMSRFGLSADSFAATVFPVTRTSTCPDKYADKLAALSPKRIISVSFGPFSVSSRSSRVPPVTPTFLPLRSASEDIAIFEEANAPEKNGA